MINGNNYSDYICDKHLPKYSKFINQINLITRHPSLFHLFGIYSHNPYTDFISISNNIKNWFRLILCDFCFSGSSLRVFSNLNSC